MTDLPDEIMVWRSMEKLTHIGTWATERYPEEAVAFVSRADAEAAMAAMVEQAAKDARDVFSDHKDAKDAIDYMEQLIYAALARIDGLALVRELRAESETRHQLRLEQVRITNEWIAERDRLAAANAVLEAKVAGLREAVDEQTKARAQHWLRRTMTAPEDAEVEALCERCGYGAVMDAASRLWARKPYGSGAFYIGGCIGFKSDEEASAALATQEAGT